MKSRKIESPTSRIRYWRLNRGITLSALSLGSGIETSYISKMELGQVGIRLDHLRKIACFLGLNVGDLLIPEDNPNCLNEEEAFLLDQIRTNPILAHIVMVLAKNPIRVDPK